MLALRLRLFRGRPTTSVPVSGQGTVMSSVGFDLLRLLNTTWLSIFTQHWSLDSTMAILISMTTRRSRCTVATKHARMSMAMCVKRRRNPSPQPIEPKSSLPARFQNFGRRRPPLVRQLVQLQRTFYLLARDCTREVLLICHYDQFATQQSVPLHKVSQKDSRIPYVVLRPSCIHDVNHCAQIGAKLLYQGSRQLWIRDMGACEKQCTTTQPLNMNARVDGQRIDKFVVGVQSVQDVRLSTSWEA